jgi:hypothetical protein
MRETELAAALRQAHKATPPINPNERRNAKMSKKFLITWVATFVVWMGGSFAVHGAWLSADYQALVGKLFRAQNESGGLFPLMLLAHVIMSGAFAWIYERGIQADRPWAGQGLRFGIAVALLTVIPTYTIYYVVQPTPGALAVKQMVGDGILLLVLGLLVAWMNRPREAAAPATA